AAATGQPTPVAMVVAPLSAVEFESNLDPHYTFDNFVEGKSNQLGRSAAYQVAMNPG
ncbi:MAG: chromosomal replication initiator protein DnaA, partial [Lysobacterales bacterium CG_4_9_14_3_um_filter_62_6]